MWVYIGTSELKNAYIGEVYEYSYDFRGKSTSQITADGRSYSAWATPSFWTYWVYGGSSVRLSYDISSHISNAKKIKLDFTTKTSSYSWAWFRMAKTVTSSVREGLTWPWYNNTSEIYMNIYDSSNSFSWITSWTYQFTSIIDLEAKTWGLSITWKSDVSWTLTDSQVSNILSNTTKIFVFISSADSNQWISTVSITIGY